MPPQNKPQYKPNPAVVAASAAAIAGRRAAAAAPPAEPKALPTAVLTGSTELSADEEKYFQTGGAEGGEEDTSQVDDSAAARATADETTTTEEHTEETDPAAATRTVVPHGALHEERELRKAAEARAVLSEKNRLLLEERTNKILQAMTQMQPAQPAVPQPQRPEPIVIPDITKDPLGHVVGIIRQQGLMLQQQQNEIRRLAEFRDQTAQSVEHGAQISTLQRHAMAAENEFAVANPDYNEASKFLGDLRHRQLIDMGYVNPAERTQMINNEAMGIAARAAQMGKNPAEMVYNLAKSMGYTKKDAAALAAGTNGTANGAAAAVSAARLATTARGVAENRSLSGARGGARPPLTANRLLEMSEADFDRMLSIPEGLALLG